MTDIEAKAIALHIIAEHACEAKVTANGMSVSDEDFILIEEHVHRECERMKKLAKLMLHHVDKFKKDDTD